MLAIMFSVISMWNQQATVFQENMEAVDLNQVLASVEPDMAAFDCCKRGKNNLPGEFRGSGLRPGVDISETRHDGFGGCKGRRCVKPAGSYSPGNTEAMGTDRVHTNRTR